MRGGGGLQNEPCAVSRPLLLLSLNSFVFSIELPPSSLALPPPIAFDAKIRKRKRNRDYTIYRTERRSETGYLNLEAIVFALGDKFSDSSLKCDTG